MNPRRLLTASLLLNAAFILAAVAFVARKGGPRYVAEQLGLATHSAEFSPAQESIIDHYKAMPIRSGDAVFIGDSITHQAPLAEYLSPIRNRGVGSDTSAGVLARIDDDLKGQPAKVVINIGTNDLNNDVAPEEIAANVAACIERGRELSPSTGFVVCSVLPIRVVGDKVTWQERKQREIVVLNGLLKELAGATFVDLHSQFVDDSGQMKEELTTDGLHLNFAGQRRYCEALR